VSETGVGTLGLHCAYSGARQFLVALAVLPSLFRLRGDPLVQNSWLRSRACRFCNSLRHFTVRSVRKAALWMARVASRVRPRVETLPLILATVIVAGICAAVLVKLFARLANHSEVACPG
jgi:hypothetical protein